MSIFDVYEKKPKRNVFQLSHNRKYTMQDFGVLYPILCKPLMPGDVVSHSHEHYAQFMPMWSTVLHRFHVKTYYFYVPNRIIWDKFDEFISQDPNKYSDGPIVHPFTYMSDFFDNTFSSVPNAKDFTKNGSLADYLGFRTWDSNVNSSGYASTNDNMAWNTLPFRAYQKIWFDYFRDEETNASNSEEPGDYHMQGREAASAAPKLFCLRSKAWGKDPFTTALKFRTPHGYVPSINGQFNVEDLRNLNSTTRFFERVMRSGTRAQEFIHATFGVKAADYRLDMPEFLCASDSMVILGNVFNSEATSGTSVNQAQSYCVSTARSSSIAGGFKYKCREFGWLIGLATLVPDAVYYQGQALELQKIGSNLDYPFPDFARLGDQEIFNWNLFYKMPLSATEANTNKAVWAYGPRYWNWKFYFNTLHGNFREAAYNFYHDARQFSSWPTRNQSFVYVANSDGTGRVGIRPSDGTDPSNLRRIFNVNDGGSGDDGLKTPIVICDLFHNIKALRPLPYTSIPKL